MSQAGKDRPELWLVLSNKQITNCLGTWSVSLLTCKWRNWIWNWIQHLGERRCSNFAAPSESVPFFLFHYFFHFIPRANRAGQWHPSLVQFSVSLISFSSLLHFPFVSLSPIAQVGLVWEFSLLRHLRTEIGWGYLIEFFKTISLFILLAITASSSKALLLPLFYFHSPSPFPSLGPITVTSPTLLFFLSTHTLIHILKHMVKALLIFTLK